MEVVTGKGCEQLVESPAGSHLPLRLPHYLPCCHQWLPVPSRRILVGLPRTPSVPNPPSPAQQSVPVRWVGFLGIPCPSVPSSATHWGRVDLGASGWHRVSPSLLAGHPAPVVTLLQGPRPALPFSHLLDSPSLELRAPCFLFPVSLHTLSLPLTNTFLIDPFRTPTRPSKLSSRKDFLGPWTCCVSLCCTAKWIRYTYTYIHSFLDSLPASHAVSSLCCVCWCFDCVSYLADGETFKAPEVNMDLLSVHFIR